MGRILSETARQQPLGAFPLVSTANVDEAETLISALQAPVQVAKTSREEQFGFKMNGRALSRVFLGYNRFETDTLVQAIGPIEDALVIVMGEQRGGSSYMDFDGERVGFNNARAGIASPTRVGNIWRPARSGAFILSLSASTISKRFQELTGRAPTGPVLLNKGVDTTKGAGRIMKECFGALIAEVEREGQIEDRQLLVSLLEDTLINSVLALPGQLRDELERKPSLKEAPWVVRQAEEYIAANVTEPITVSDLVEICQCSSSTLYETFKSERGYTPMQFLVQQRLELARSKLINETYVNATAIALECGFNNYGRFSKAYGSRFHETPGATQRKRNNPRVRIHSRR